MSNLYNRYQKFPDEHKVITPSDTVNLSEPMLVMVGTSGTVAAVDKNDVVIVYNITSPPVVLPVLVKRVNATNTTATQLIGLY